MIGYNETSQSWKFRYIKNIWNSRQIEITQTTDILEDSDLDKFCLDLYSVKLKLEKFKKKFHDNLENEFGIHQNELTRLTIELNEHVEKGNYLYKNLHQITDIKIPEVASLYEKIKQQ